MKESAEILLEKADRNLYAANHDLPSEDPKLIENICYNSQQAVEKYLKVYISYNNIEYPHGHDGHDIGKLLDICKGINSVFNELDKVNPDILTDYAVNLRYEEMPVPSMEDAKEAVSIAEAVRPFVLDKIKDISTDKTRDKEPDKNGPDIDIDF